MSDDSDAYTIVAPHVITPFERRFYYNGISGDPPELLYRSDLETKPFYVPTPGAHFSKIPTKIPNGVFDSVLNPKWDEIGAPRFTPSSSKMILATYTAPFPFQVAKLKHRPVVQPHYTVHASLPEVLLF